MSELAARVSALLESARLRGVTLGAACREAGISARELTGVMGARPDLAAAWRQLRADSAGRDLARGRHRPFGSVGAILPNGRRHNGATTCVLASCEYARDGRYWCAHHRNLARAFWRDLAADLRNGRIDDADYPKPGE